MTKKLYKSRTDVKLDGVCAGLAKYIGVDPTVVRLAWVVFSLIGGSGLIAYIVCAVLMPREPKETEQDDYESREN